MRSPPALLFDALPPLETVPDFVRAAVNDAPDLAQVLKATKWGAAEVGAWWQAVMVVCHDSVENHAWHVQHAENSDEREARQYRVLEALGHGLPRKFHDLERLKELVDRPFLDPQAMTLSAQMGPEAFWDWRAHKLTLHQSQVGFDWVAVAFTRLPLNRRYAELDKSWERLSKRTAALSFSTNLTFDLVPTLYASTPDWPHWEALLKEYCDEGVKAQSIKQLYAQLKQKKLEGAWSATGDGAKPNRPRM